MEDVLKQILDKMKSMEKQMATKEELNEIRSTMATKEELNEIRSQLNEVKSQMATKEDVAELPFIRQAVIEMKTDIKEIKQDVKRHDSEIVAMNERLFRVEAEVVRLAKQ